jgi:hypothetical protein
MPEDKLSYLRSSKGYKFATQNMQAQEVAYFEHEYLNLCPLRHGGIAGNYVIGTDNNLSRFYLTIDSIRNVYLLNETRKAKLLGITYLTKTYLFLVMIYQEGGYLKERRFVLDKDTEEKLAMNFINILLTRNSNIKIGQ